MIKKGKKRVNLDGKLEKRARYGYKLHGSAFDYSHLKRRAYSSPEDLQKAMIKYFEARDEEEKPYTLSGLLLSLGLSSQNLQAIHERGEGFKEVIEWSRLVIEDKTHTLALMEKVSSSVASLTLKNQFGWTDKKEVTTREGAAEEYDLWIKTYNQKLKGDSKEVIDVTPKELDNVKSN